MAVSIATHLTVLIVGLGYAGVRPFKTTPAEAITVDIVSPDEVKQAAREPPPKATPPLEIPDLSTKDQAAESKPAPPPQQPQQQEVSQQQASAARSNPTADAKQAAIEPAAAAASQAPAAPQPAASWQPPEPDLSVKYPVNLGLPARPGYGFDTVAFSAANVSTDDVGKFREHLKGCSVLPASIASADKVTIRLRAIFLPDGTLASAPLLIEASASAKGPLLMQAAIEALAACQPYAMLPADKYSEWKVLDLSFTPRDFKGG
jgi:hypothetical protein